MRVRSTCLCEPLKQLGLKDPASSLPTGQGNDRLGLWTVLLRTSGTELAVFTCQNRVDEYLILHPPCHPSASVSPSVQWRGRTCVVSRKLSEGTQTSWLLGSVSLIITSRSTAPISAEGLFTQDGGTHATDIILFGVISFLRGSHCLILAFIKFSKYLLCQLPGLSNLLEVSS